MPILIYWLFQHYIYANKNQSIFIARIKELLALISDKSTIINYKKGLYI